MWQQIFIMLGVTQRGKIPAPTKVTQYGKRGHRQYNRQLQFSVTSAVMGAVQALWKHIARAPHPVLEVREGCSEEDATELGFEG